MSACGICFSVIIRSVKENFECKNCNCYFHWKCLKITQVEANLLKNWVCPECVKRLKIKSVQSKPNLGRESEIKGKMEDLKDFLEKQMRDLKSEMGKINQSQIKLEEDINKSINFCNEKVDENSKIISQQNKLIENQQRIIDKLLAENKSLKTQVVELKNEVDAVNQESRLNSVEIHGLPFQENEPAFSVLQRLAKAIEFEVTEEMVDNIFKIKSKQSPGHNMLVVRFLRRADKSRFLARKKGKRDLNTSNLGYMGSSPIYINDSLTQARRVLLSKARRFKRDKGWKYVWVSGGKIMLRQTDSSKILSIATDEDFSRIVSIIA
ncbi:hypothetical protein RI129_009176 [Pyrocoelia pectoralis]|uniref:Zinc finger PHD-type domain-containing protein n=1 Tax=Pyrocoelia pectoralis TaxID=417401 RepID=A0AAN7VGT1_9COLE